MGINSKTLLEPIRLFDVILSLILIILSFPFLLISLILSGIFIGSPPIYISKRIGKKGELYKHFKIKTMLPGKECGRIFFEQERLNWCGRFLRRYHLDEIPELYLILAGKMSFVGPRPLPENLLEGQNVKVRNSVPPGWTGLAQIYLLKNGVLNKKLQVKFDNHYVSKRSLKYNINIILMTLIYTFKRKGLDIAPDSTKDRVEFKRKLS